MIREPVEAGWSKMRKLIVLGLVTALTMTAAAARRNTVAQLEQSLVADSAAHKADAEIAHRLGDLALSERLTDPTLNRLAARVPLGPRTALALKLLADQSAFLDPPAIELPATAFPDAATQQRLLDAARGYVAQSLPRLPNFFASRTTTRFDDSPQVLARGDWPVRAGLHPVGSATREITFRDGKEVQDTEAASAAAPAQKAQQELGLHTWGEFGPAMSVVLTDAAHGSVSFHHWEQSAAGLAAVYRYSVPRAASHYAVSYCCLSDAPIAIQHQAGGRRDMTVPVSNLPGANLKPYTETPGYHGSLSIDPATGAILRITLEAELSSGDPLLRAATVVEYGHVPIGDRICTCPVRSLAFSMEETQGAASAAGPGGPIASNTAVDRAWGGGLVAHASSPVLLINETTFTRYHRLGSTVRIVADAADAPPPAPSDEPAAPAPETAAATAQPNPPPAAETASAVPPPGPPPAPVAPPAPAQPVIPEISLTAAKGVPDQPASLPQAPEGSYSFKLSSRLVDVGVVAYDKKNHPVQDLKAEDFEVYDNGRRQEIRFFSRFASASAAAPLPTPTEQIFSNRPAPLPEGSAAAPPSESGSTILLIDESHIAWGDLTWTRQQMLKFLTSLAPGERVGLYTITRTGFRVLVEITTDHPALIAVLQKWMPSAQSASQAGDEERRNRQQFDTVHSVADLNSVNGNQIDVPDTETTVDPMLRSEGSNPARSSLLVLVGVARHLSAIAGHKNLVWVSTDNVFADWENQAVAIDKSPRMIGSFARRVQEAMNDAHVAVFPMDVSQLESAAITADVRTRNVELNQAAQDTASLNGGAVGRNMGPGRITAQMQQDMHPIQGPIREVADATGGRVIRRSGDLAAQLSGVVDDGRATCLLSFSPQGPADDQYHAITVKLAKRGGVSLRYRTGYLYQKEPATLRERFQQAVWLPTDAGEIAVSATGAAMNPGANLKISIAASDLSLEQQAGRWTDKLDIFFIQRDDEGLHAQVEGQTLGLRLKSSTYQNLLPTGVPFDHFVQLKPGMASLRVLVVDENSGRMGSVTLPFPALGGKP